MTALSLVLAAQVALSPDSPSGAPLPPPACGHCSCPKSLESGCEPHSWLTSNKGLALGLASGLTTGVAVGRRFDGSGESPGALFRGGKPWIAWGAAGGLLAAKIVLHEREEPPKVTAPWRTLEPPNFVDAAIRHRLGGALSPKARRLFDGASYVTLGHLVAQPLGLASSGGRRSDRWQDAVIPFEAAAVAALATEQVKHLVHRPRPFAYYCEPLGSTELADRDAQLSFFSGHTSIAFALAAATSGVASERRLPNAKALRHVSYGVAGATGLFRVMADRHYATDVVVGGVVGWLTGRTLAKWHADAARREPVPIEAVPAPIAVTIPVGGGGVVHASFGDGFSARLVIVR